MSKFEELCYLYNRSHDQMSDYLESCVQFIEKLILGMEVYLECPEKRVQHKDKLGEETGLREAMYLKNGFWHFDTEITMCRETAYRRRAADFTRCYYPRQTILLPLYMTRATAKLFVIGIDGYPQQFSINVDDQSSFEAFYEFIYEAVRAYYENIFQSIIEHGESPRRIEFQQMTKCFESKST